MRLSMIVKRGAVIIFAAGIGVSLGYSWWDSDRTKALAVASNEIAHYKAYEDVKDVSGATYALNVKEDGSDENPYKEVKYTAKTSTFPQTFYFRVFDDMTFKKVPQYTTEFRYDDVNLLNKKGKN